MDAVDAMILRQLSWDPRDPFHRADGPLGLWDAARALGIHGTTVKRRLADLSASGVLRGIHLHPAPALVRRTVQHHMLRFADVAAKRRGMRSVMEEPDVWAAHSIVGDGIVVTTATRHDEPPDARIAEIAADAGAAQALPDHPEAWEVATERVTSIDLRILAALAEDALRPASEVAAEVGVTARTVSNRLKHLAALRAFHIEPTTEYSRIEGAIFFGIRMLVEDGRHREVAAEVASRFPLASCRSIGRPRHAYVVLSTTRPATVEDEVARAQSIPGVVAAQPTLLETVESRPARWRDALLERAEEIGLERGATSVTRRLRARQGGA